MPVVQTQGFNVGVLPSVNFADPRLLTANLSGILPAAEQGLGMYNKLRAIGDEARARPLREQLQALQLQEQQNRLAMAPLEQQLRLAQISEAQQNAAVPREVVQESVITGGIPLPREITNEGANFEDLKFSSPGYSPQVKTVRGLGIAGGGITTPFTKTETLKTGAQVEADMRKLEADISSKEALNTYRGDLGEAALQRAANAQKKIQQGKKLSQGVNPTTGTLIVTVQNPDGTIEQIDTLTIPPPSLLEKLIADAGGLGLVPPKNVAVPPPAKAARPAGQAPAFNTADEAASAAAAGIISPGDQIIVGGVPGKWQ